MLTEKLDFSNLRRLGEHFLLFQASAPHPALAIKKFNVFPINLSQKVFLCSDDLLCRRPFRTIVPQDLHQLRTNLPQNLHHSQSVMHKFTLRFALFVVRYAPIYPKICTVTVDYAPIYPKIYINRSPLCTSFTPRFVGLGSS